jgi:hypothetical protein
MEIRILEDILVQQNWNKKETWLIEIDTVISGHSRNS